MNILSLLLATSNLFTCLLGLSLTLEGLGEGWDPLPWIPSFLGHPISSSTRSSNPALIPLQMFIIGRCCQPSSALKVHSLVTLKSVHQSHKQDASEEAKYYSAQTWTQTSGLASWFHHLLLCSTTDLHL